MKETSISVLGLLSLFLLEVVSANEIINGTFVLEGINKNASGGVFANGDECGMQANHRSKCPSGQCCSIWGWCGTTSEYCGSGFCQNQCTGPSPHGSCGMQGGGTKCPSGQCCSLLGWCGTGSYFCKPENCQSQCSGPFPNGRCGWQADGKLCPHGVCCSVDGWCGTTTDYCANGLCQSQCPFTPPPPPPPSPPPPSPPPSQYQCGIQNGGTKCNRTGECCGISGMCGNTYEYCFPGYCQMQCPGPYPEGRCGWQADGKSCPTGLCCGNSGWCGIGPGFCDPIFCQSQCSGAPISTAKQEGGIRSFLLNAALV
ncbi:hypothetical protein EJD97_020491 [Solanum chilense]|uniref:Chitin-binding type-1 domain-containing protein n=1 Tax=Solanum chilense TaxID=4083 RepID=A0A6N2AZ74_SOLCI|nr:hypothetical protein EJD97_020491 [Solanum chilense]